MTDAGSTDTAQGEALPATPALPALYLEAEAAARPELDRPDHAALAVLLALGVNAAGMRAASSTDAENEALREALPRAARILNPNVFVPIANYPPDVDAVMAAIVSPDPIMRRFGAAQYFIDWPRQDTSWGKPFPTFPTTLVDDGDVVYVPFLDGAQANVTLESVAKADADPAVVGLIQPAAGTVDGGAAAVLATLPTTGVPFPHDAADAHPIDATPAGTVTTIVAPGTVAVARPGSPVTPRPIQVGDPLAHLPVGATVTTLGPGAMAVELPATTTRPAVESRGSGVIEALRGVWPWLVKEGHALIAEVVHIEGEAVTELKKI